MSTVTDAGLCHGIAGTLQSVRRVAGDAVTRGLTAHIPQLTDRALAATAKDVGLLEGRAGIALTLADEWAGSDWDVCLLLS